MRRTDYDLPIFENSDMSNLNLWTEETAEALKVQIDKFGFPLVYKGTVATLEDLPESEVGSIYSVTSENKNYVWNGTDWVEYSPTLDLSYLKPNLLKVSPTEPTTGEEVWFKKGNQLFDKNNPTFLANSTLSGGVIANESNARLDYIKCDPNTTYVIQKAAGKRFRVAYTTSTPITGTAIRGFISYDTGSKTTITTGANAEYIVFCGYNADLDSITIQEYLDSIMINQGSTALPYENYIDKEIYTKNENGNYEKFLNDTGWVDLSGFVNTTYCSVRSGFPPRARRIGNIIYFDGEVYISQAPSSNRISFITNLPIKFRPASQFSRCCTPYLKDTSFNLYVDSLGNITASTLNNFQVQTQYSGFQLTNLSGCLAD